jgi:DNA-directed RNA polymerase specialized sigma24 family protein
MTKLTIALSLVLGACGASPRITATPEQRAAAMQLYMAGASTHEVADRLAMQPDDARELIHTTLRDLNRRYYRNDR